jgi:hypothetical protein
MYFRLSNDVSGWLGQVTENKPLQHPTINRIFLYQNSVFFFKFQFEIHNQHCIPRLIMLDLLEFERKNFSIILGSPTGAQWTAKNESRFSTAKSI